MLKYNIIIAILIFCSTLSYGQDCNCVSNFEWLKNTFEKNDAGFQYVIDIKGKQDYLNHNTLYFQKVKTLSCQAHEVWVVYLINQHKMFYFFLDLRRKV